MLSEVNYSKKIKGIQNLIQVEGINNFLAYEMRNNPSESLTGTVIVNKKIKKIKYRMKVYGITSKVLEQVNLDYVTAKSIVGNYKISARTLYEKFPIIEAGFKQSVGSYSVSGQKFNFITNEPYINIDYDFLKGFIFSFNYSYYNYQNKDLNQKNTYQIGNSTLSYRKEDSAWSFKLDAQNIFDVQFKNSNSFSSYIISDTKTYIMPRVLMFTLGYNL